MGLTQSQMAKLSEVSQSLIAKMEKNIIDPAYGKVRKIDQALIKEEAKEDSKARAKDIHTKRIIKIDASDTIISARKMMLKHGFSQLPVFHNDRVVGSITENEFLNVLSEKNNYSLKPSMKIEIIMDFPFPQLDENTPIEPIKSLLYYYPAVLTTKKDKIVGIICKSDMLKLVKN
jgi:predicted transcriptional regulator